LSGWGLSRVAPKNKGKMIKRRMGAIGGGGPKGPQLVEEIMGTDYAARFLIARRSPNGAARGWRGLSVRERGPGKKSPLKDERRVSKKGREQ